MQINVSYDASAANVPPGFFAAIQYVVSLYQNLRRTMPETYESTSLVFGKREMRKTGKYDMQPGHQAHGNICASWFVRRIHGVRTPVPRIEGWGQVLL
jgi:hypothetical protein